jgi:hypothetical protein
LYDDRSGMEAFLLDGVFGNIKLPELKLQV